MTGVDLFATLLPTFPHFARFASDVRLAGIRLNSAMTAPREVEEELTAADAAQPSVPLWFDVKGRQPRVAEVHPDPDRLVVTLNHAVRVADLPQPVLFKAGEDAALLERLEDGGRRLVFAPGRTHGPVYAVQAGESLHVRHPSFTLLGPLFTDEEKAKIETVRRSGIRRWFLSYVESEADVHAFLELAGRDAELMLKIENERGVRRATQEFRKRDGRTLVAARGDLYVEIGRPHHMPRAVRAILRADPEAMVGSRLLLSVMQPLLADVKRGLAFVQSHPDDDGRRKAAAKLAQPRVPSCADFSELAWLADIGYRRFLLCDELCLDGALLAAAMNAFWAFMEDGVR